MRQPFGFWMILAGGSPQFLVTPETLVICISEFRCWCSVSMLLCYTTACRSLTAQTEHHTLSVIFINFKTSLGNRYRGLKIIIIIIHHNTDIRTLHTTQRQVYIYVRLFAYMCTIQQQIELSKLRQLRPSASDCLTSQLAATQANSAWMSPAVVRLAIKLSGAVI